MTNPTNSNPCKLSEKNLCNIIRGTKLHRRLTHRQTLDVYESENSDSDSDLDYMPQEDEAEFSDSCEDVSSDEDTSINNTSTLSATSTGTSCIKEMLLELKKITNKHKWSDKNIDSLLQKYLSNHQALSKLFMYEMDIINNLIQQQFGVHLFNK